jgi:hypothetical protein
LELVTGALQTAAMGDFPSKEKRIRKKIKKRKKRNSRRF